MNIVSWLKGRFSLVLRLCRASSQSRRRQNATGELAGPVNDRA